MLLAIVSLDPASGQATPSSSQRQPLSEWQPPVRANPLRSQVNGHDQKVTTEPDRGPRDVVAGAVVPMPPPVLVPTAYAQELTGEQEGSTTPTVPLREAPEPSLAKRDWVAIPTQPPVYESTGHGVVTVSGVNELGMPVYSHEIIRAPRITTDDGSHRGYVSGGTARRIRHLPHLIHHSPEQAPQAVIPDASHSEVWKSPYSYGHFGASSGRHWKLHFGYRDRDKEWRLR